MVELPAINRHLVCRAFQRDVLLDYNTYLLDPSCCYPFFPRADCFRRGGCYIPQGRLTRAVGCPTPPFTSRGGVACARGSKILSSGFRIRLVSTARGSRILSSGFRIRPMSTTRGSGILSSGFRIRLRVRVCISRDDIGAYSHENLTNRGCACPPPVYGPGGLPNHMFVALLTFHVLCIF